MSEISVSLNIQQPLYLRRKPFLGCFFAAPLIAALPTIFVPMVGAAALVIGYPLYVLVGLPGLSLYLCFCAPRYLAIGSLSVLAQFALVGIAGLGTGRQYETARSLLPFSVAFGLAWALVFTFLYRRALREEGVAV